MGYARTVLNSPFTVNDISHAEGFSDDKDWVIALRRRLAARRLVSIWNLPELLGIEVLPDEVRVGA